MSTFIGQSFGRYHVLEQLGEGGMATVFKAYDTRLERDVAIKIIRVDQFAPAILERILKRFEREAKALARLTHPNIVHVHDYGEHEGVPFLVMDYLPGGTLKQRLGKAMPWDAAVRLLLPVAEALAYAHEHNILHRDVKPSNILLAEKGQPQLTDFGIAKILDLEDGQTLTGTGAGIGTPEYMSPEQGLGQPVDARTDIYSLGVVLYELVTGRKPYSADTPMAIAFKHVSEPLPHPSVYSTDLPENVEKLLLKALAKKPEDRFKDMEEFTRALEGLLLKGDGTAVTQEKEASTPLPPTVPQILPAVKSPPIVEKGVTGETIMQPEEPPPPSIPAIKPVIQVPVKPPARRKKGFLWWGIGAGALMLICIIGAGLLLSKTIKTYLFPEPFSTYTRAPTRYLTPTNYLHATYTAQAESAARALTQSAKTQMVLTETARAWVAYGDSFDSRAELIYGPASGSLVHDPEFLGWDVRPVSLQNLIISAVFDNPYGTSTGSWDYGFSFRQKEWGNSYVFILSSSGGWILLQNSPSESITRGEGTASVDISTGGSNKIELFCDGGYGLLIINDSDVFELDLVDLQQAGEVAIFTNYWYGDAISGYTTDFNNFLIWELP